MNKSGPESSRQLLKNYLDLIQQVDALAKSFRDLKPLADRATRESKDAVRLKGYNETDKMDLYWSDLSEDILNDLTVQGMALLHVQGLMDKVVERAARILPKP